MGGLPGESPQATAAQTGRARHFLYDVNRKTNFFLGDRHFDGQLERFCGRSVTVTGTIDPRETLINIASIQSIQPIN